MLHSAICCHLTVKIAYFSLLLLRPFCVLLFGELERSFFAPIFLILRHFRLGLAFHETVCTISIPKFSKYQWFRTHETLRNLIKIDVAVVRRCRYYTTKEWRYFVPYSSKHMLLLKSHNHMQNDHMKNAVNA